MWGLLAAIVSTATTSVLMFTPPGSADAQPGGLSPTLLPLPPLASILPVRPPVPTLPPTSPPLPSLTPGTLPKPQVSVKVVIKVQEKTKTNTKVIVSASPVSSKVESLRYIYVPVPQPERTVLKRITGSSPSVKRTAFNLGTAMLIGLVCLIAIYVAGYKSGKTKESITLKQLLKE